VSNFSGDYDRDKKYPHSNAPTFLGSMLGCIVLPITIFAVLIVLWVLLKIADWIGLIHLSH
jgi:hypothetical protein